MSTNPSAPSASAASTSGTTQTKKTTIVIGDTGKSKGIFAQPEFLIKAFRIALTFFYGQFFANAIYDNLIRGIPYVIDNATAFPIMKIVIGTLIILLTIFSMVAIWRKIWFLIFASAIALIALSLFSLIVSVIDLVQRKNERAMSNQELSADIAEIVVESLFRILAIVIKFVMVKLVRGYQHVPSSA